MLAMVEIKAPCWGNSHEEIFEDILRFMRFGVYFERILNVKSYFHVEII